MNERAIFMEALDRDLPAERAAYVDAACAGDPALRERVEALLRADHEAGEFLGRPVPDRLAGPPASGAADTRAGPAADEPLDFLAPSDRPGSLGRLGHYEVQSVVGRGGMGVVLRAFDENLHRVAAVKVMAPPLAASATARRRFVREARAQAAVSHDQVVTIHAVEEADGPLPYIVMQYVDGMSLQDRLDRSGPLPLPEVLRIGVQAAAGLAAAHAQGLVHRDVKPANILLENGVERVKLTDFGLARAADDATLTQAGQVAGTPEYMSPEQAEGQPVDHRADLFSLGSVLYAMCAGRPPFRGSTARGVLKRVVEDAPPPVREANPEVPDWLAAVIDKLHAKDPAARYQSAAEVAELLGRHLAHVQHPSVVELPAPATAVTPPHRRPRWATAAAVLLALLAGLGATEATGVTKVRATVVRILTPDGVLVVEADDPDVRITIEGDGGLVITGAGPQEVRLKPGSYKVRADKGGRPLKEELVTISRGGTRTVTVSRDAGPTPAAAAAEHGAFVVLVGKGDEVRKYDTLAKAVAGAADGDTVEIRGNGPFVTPPIYSARSLIIRAGYGFRPTVQLDPRMSSPLLSCEDKTLVLEGIEFVLLATGPSEKYPNLLRATGGVLHVANCRLVRKLSAQGACVGCTEVTRAEFRNTEFIRYGNAGGGVGIGYLCPPTGALLVENCVDAGWYDFLVPTLDVATARQVSIRLRHNTSAAEVGVYVMPTGLPQSPPQPGAAPLTLESTGNVFHFRRHVFVFGPRDLPGVSPPKPTLADLCRRYCAWREGGSLYPREALLGVVGDETDRRYGASTVASGQAEWNRFWDVRPTGSLGGAPKFRGGDVYAAAKGADPRLKPDDFRLLADSPGYRAGKDGKDLGADIDLVGPGPAYGRWKKTPEYQEWLATTGQKK